MTLHPRPNRAQRHLTVTALLLLISLAGCTGQRTPADVPEPGSTRTSPGDGMAQVYIPAGEFLMGSTEADIDQVLRDCSDCSGKWFANEIPQHRVYLDGFWIDQTEVTNAMFARFVGETGYVTGAEKAGGGIVLDLLAMEWKMTAGADWRHPRGPGTSIEGLGDHPVVQTSHDDALAYCQWAGRRLPTEAEWEKAARGTDGRIYPWGNQAPAGHLLNFADRNAYVRSAEPGEDDGYLFTAPVGSYPDGASPYGVLDMAGNAWERVSDRYGATYYADSPARNPTGPSSGDTVVIRGGSSTRPASYVRTALRYRYPPKNRSSGIGFRCAASS